MTLSVRKVAVIGAGVMGGGIAQVLAVNGYDVTCHDLRESALEAALEGIKNGRFGLARSVERGRISDNEMQNALQRLHFVTDLEEAVPESDLVLEAVYEDLALKIALFRSLNEMAPERAILCSNTSGFSVGAMAAATDRPAQVIGWHWASPPPVMRMAEIVVHGIAQGATSDETRDTVVEVARRCGKNPVVVKDNPRTWGFVANRVYGAMIREAERVVAEGMASAEEVNQLMMDCFNWPVGPLALVKGARGGWKQ